MREIAVRTAGAATSSGASMRSRAATGAAPPRGRRWSPYTSKRAERAFTKVQSAAPRLPRCDNGRRTGCATDVLTRQWDQVSALMTKGRCAHGGDEAEDGRWSPRGHQGG